MSLETDCEDPNAVDFSYSFLTGIDPAHPPSSIRIPDKALDAMANMERQYWGIKARRYNVLIFFKKGSFYELYDYDAVIANKEFGLKMVADTTNRGKMRMAGVPEKAFGEWARLFVFRGYKVGRVEQMTTGKGDECGGGDSPGAAAMGGGSKAPTIMPRELVEVLTPGTLTDAVMLSDHNEVFLLAFAARPADRVVDAFAVDLSRHVVHWCPCGDAAAVQRYTRRHAAATLPVKQEADAGKTSDIKEEGHRGDADADGQQQGWSDAAMRSVTALLQQLHPREVVMAAMDAGASTSDTSTADAALCAEQLGKWIRADGVNVEEVPVPSAGTAGGVPTARQTIADYLRSLKLDHKLPLLGEATLYTSHVFDSAASAATHSPQQQRQQVPNRPASLLAWERRFAPGLVLDSATVSNLEIVANLQDGSERQSLHQCLNGCITNGGKRLFRAWVLRPAGSVRAIRARQDAVRLMLEGNLVSGNDLWGGSSTGGGRASGDGGLALTPASAASTQDTPRSSCGSLTLSGVKRPRDSSSGAAHFSARFANMLAVDFERNLSRLAEIKDDQQRQTISYVDPLVMYHKNLAIIVATVQAFSEMVEWATQFHAACRRQRMSQSQPSQQPGIASSQAPITPGSAAVSQASLSPSSQAALPELLEELLFTVEAAAASVTAMERLFDRRVAAATGLLTPAPGTSEEYDTATATLAAVAAKLEAHRRRTQEEVFGGAAVGFADLGKDLFLLEVAAADAPKMTPRGMLERARSGKSVKYAADALQPLVEAHKAATTAKSAALLNVLQNVAAKMCDHCPSLSAAAGAVAYVDCLVNLARLAYRFPNTCLPTIVDDGPEGEGQRLAFVEARDMVHPLLTANSGAVAGRTGSSSTAAAPVPNSISLDAACGRLLLLTGPNMAGKSTLMRTVAVSLLMAQLGGPVLCGGGMRFAPVTRIFTRIGARDAAHKGQSTLFVELSETADILRAANGRSLCLIDELGRGTSTHDGLAIAYAALQALKGAAQPPLTVFSTHYHSLALEQLRRGQQHQQPGKDGGSSISSNSSNNGGIQLGYMDFALTSAPSSTAAAAAAPVPKITFLYQLVPGICDRSYGVEVALMAGVGPALVEVARDKSAQLARVTAMHEDIDAIQQFLGRSS